MPFKRQIYHFGDSRNLIYPSSESECVDAERVAKILDTDRAIVIGSRTSIFRVHKELAEELWRLIELIAPCESCIGYAVVNGESIVFQKGSETIIAFVEDDKIMGSIRRLSENV